MKRLALITGCAFFYLAACAGSEQANTSDDQYGHRYEGHAPDGRETIIATEPDTTEQYITVPAVVDSVSVRPALNAINPGQEVAVEVLIKGALPDGCSELNEPTQSQIGHLIDVNLSVRRPRGAMCIEVVRPFRFYLPLDGHFSSGAYNLKINGRSHPFQIQAGEVVNN